jgi:hypothetical protein
MSFLLIYAIRRKQYFTSVQLSKILYLILNNKLPPSFGEVNLFDL